LYTDLTLKLLISKSQRGIAPAKNTGQAQPEGLNHQAHEGARS
jgi:hypothetical protein